MNRPWIETNTLHHAAFSDISALVETKERKGLTLSLCLPTLNEEKTIAKEIVMVVRPLFSLFFPELAQLLQPLSGEYAGYRTVFENIPFLIGYGVETGMILDIYRKWGLGVMAQVNLDKRVHRNQDTRALGRMSFIIMKTFFDRIEKLGRIALTRTLFEEMIQFVLINNEHLPEIHTMILEERPPMVEVEAYRQKFAQRI